MDNTGVVLVGIDGVIWSRAERRDGDGRSGGKGVGGAPLQLHGVVGGGCVKVTSLR